MESIFSKIVKGEIPAFKIAEDDNFLAFLDAFPLVEGHTLVIPKKQTDYIFDLDDNTLANLHVFAKRVAVALGKSIECKRIGVSVVGLEVPHAHIHLIPINHVGDMNFMRPKIKVSDERNLEILEKIKENL